MRNEFIMSKARQELAESALYEITMISIALRDHIAEHDSTGAVQYVSRGMLARVQQLSEAVSDCLGTSKDESAEEAELYRLIECRANAAPEEVAHE